MPIYKINLLLFFVFAIPQCKPKQSLQDKRLEVIHQAIKAILQSDTTKLYNLVYTSFYFDIYGKDDFLFTVENLSEKFKKCGIQIDEANIKIMNTPVHTKEFVLKFCRDNDNSINKNSFDLTFKFANFQNLEKIMSFDINNYFELKKAEFTEPISK